MILFSFNSSVHYIEGLQVIIDRHSLLRDYFHRCIAVYAYSTYFILLLEAYLMMIR